VQRKTVTVLFCDVTGSTALGETSDPEAVRGLLARYFERMKTIVERHGGSVEKFIGDAVMAVFGVPVAHEDDALRAVRAATEMRDALPELGVQARIGIMTGEVVTGTEERLATGDAVNVAARLEQAAQPDEVLIGEQTFTLVRDAVDAQPVEPLVLKGKAERVSAYRLVHVREAPKRRHEARFVGRERELTVVRDAFERADGERRCELATIIGDAGVGKSRLAAEVLASLEATVVQGRCLPYGEGITYWPVVEVLKQLRVMPPDEAAAEAIRSVLGETEAPVSAEEIAWAFRKTLEHTASDRPMVVVFDDIQWGEETFLDLIEHVALLSTGAAILLLCLARPELTDRRPAWPVALRLEPLRDHDVEQLIPERIAGDLRARIARAAGGNPLFIGEMLAMASQGDGDEVAVPPTLQALLAARLDQLETGERSVLERGAVEGEIFHRGAVQMLAPDEPQVTPRLAALVRKELIRPDKPQIPGEDGFRFRHLLIRDAAYDGLPKATRADLHERFARWLTAHGAGFVEFDEIVGYHFEQTCRYRAELGLPGDDEVQASARTRLGAAGERAFVRQDYGAAVKLLERAAALVPPGEVDPLEIKLVEALFWAGKADEALRRAGSIAERAAASGDRIAELYGRVEEAHVRCFVEPEGATERLAALVDEALPVFEAAGDDFALCAAYRALGQVESMRAQMDSMADAYDRAAVHAKRAGLSGSLAGWRDVARFHGSTRASEHLAWEDEQKDLRHWSMGRRPWALAMLGRFDEARALLAEVRGDLIERGGELALGLTSYEGGVETELLAGDAAAAVALGEEGCRLLEELGQQAALSTAAGWLAQALYAADRLDDADAWAARAAELGASDDAMTQLLWRQVRAKVLARRGERAEAERLAREAVAIGDETQMLNAQADAYADLAEVLSLGGDREKAATALEQALARYERKENLVMAERTRALLTELETAATR
jgi:class 3 adenylate cyclase/tetratricopeptide (TPR) repeat protein